MRKKKADKPIDIIESKAALFFVLFVGFILIFNDLSKPGLPSYDDCTKAQRGWEMLERGDFITPHFAGQPNFDHPPLPFWGMALSYRIFGKTEFAARLFGAICALLCILVIYKIGELLYFRRAGWFSAFFLSTSYMFMKLSRRVQTDIPFMLAASLAIYFFIKAYQATDSRKTDDKKYLYNYLLFGLFAGLSGLIKSIFVIFPLLTPGLFLLMKKEFKGKNLLGYLSGSALAVLLFGWWYIYEFVKYGRRFLNEFFAQFVGGHMDGMSGLGEFGPAGYLVEFLRHFWLWLPLTMAAFVLIFKKKFLRENNIAQLLLIYILFPFIILSIQGDKSIRYVMFMFVPLLTLTAWGLLKNLSERITMMSFKAAVIILVLLASYMIIQPVNFNKIRNNDYIILRDLINDGKVAIGNTPVYHFGEDYGLNRQPMLWYTGFDLADCIYETESIEQMIGDGKSFFLIAPKDINIDKMKFVAFLDKKKLLKPATIH